MTHTKALSNLIDLISPETLEGIDEVEFYLNDLKSKFLKIDPLKYLLSYSGGKDSHFLWWFLKVWLHDHDFEMWLEYRKIEIVSVNTYMEFPEIANRMKRNADIVLTPKMKPHEVMEKYGAPIFSKSQDDLIARYQHGNRTKATMDRVVGNMVFGKDGTEYRSSFNLNNTARELLLADQLPKVSNHCCTELKKKPAKEYAKKVGKHSILGVMGAESAQRNAKYTSCFQKNGNFTPLWDASEEIINATYERYNIELPWIYNFVNQTGCVGCPYGIYKGNVQKELSLVSQPRRDYIMKLFGESYRIRGIRYEYQTTIDDFLEEEL